MEKDDLFLEDGIDEAAAADATPATSPSWVGSTPEVLNRYSHCAICGSNLHFTYFTDFAKNMTEENAKCPECGVRAHRVVHKLQ